MGKVYDALRRAEEQRSRRVDEAAGAAAAAAMDSPAAPAPERGEPPAGALPRPEPPARRGLWRRWRERGRARGGESAAETNKRRIALLQPESYVAEQFRTLRARLDSLEAQQPLRTIAVSSSVPGEGKTTASINLALVSSMSVGRRVLLVDTDLRCPRVHGSLGVQPAAGLAEVLTGRAPAADAVVKVDGTNLEALCVRSVPPNPSELLASDAMRELVEELAQRYDRVVFDVPCTLGLPDAKTLSELCDGVVFVVRADQTPADDVRAALDMLDRRRILGLVMNGEEQDVERYAYGSR